MLTKRQLGVALFPGPHPASRHLQYEAILEVHLHIRYSVHLHRFTRPSFSIFQRSGYETTAPGGRVEELSAERSCKQGEPSEKAMPPLPILPLTTPSSYSCQSLPSHFYNFSHAIFIILYKLIYISYPLTPSA